MTKPRIGEVYERDGKQREVVDVELSGRDTYYVHWQRPSGGKVGRAWCSTWLDWSDKATLVESK